MTAEVFARAGGPRAPDVGEDDDPWLTVAELLEKIVARVDALEKRREARAGRDGQDGRGILDVRIDGASGHLMVQFSDGELRDVGKITADPAQPPKRLDFVRDEVTGKIIAARLQ
jgi:hypothetical protein